MKIDIDHLHYWLEVLRYSQDIKNLDAFTKGQLESKKWLIEKLRPFVFKEFGAKSVKIDIHGGWIGVLSSMLFQSDIPISTIRSVDIDNRCEHTAALLNSIEESQGRFTAITADICKIKSDADIIVNTVCEHLTQDQYEKWLSMISQSSLVILQSNNYKIDEHVRTADSIETFCSQSSLNIFWKGQKDTDLYTRYMLIGKKI